MKQEDSQEHSKNEDQVKEEEHATESRWEHEDKEDSPLHSAEWLLKLEELHEGQVGTGKA